jgi:TPR repeat protein
MLQAIRRLSGLACFMLGVALLAGAQLLPDVTPEKPRPKPQTKPKAALCTKPPANDQKSIAAFERQAASGDAAAQCGMALAYELGAGVPRDYAQAVLWWRKAAKQGNEAAQYWLGGGVPRWPLGCTPGLHASGFLVAQGCRTGQY